MNEYLNNKTFERLINGFQESKRKHARIVMMMDEISETVARKGTRKVDSSANRDELAAKKVMMEECKAGHEESKRNLAVAFFTLSENIVRYAKFQLIDADDAIQEGVMICFDKIDRFDSRKGKAFNYMTTCILNHFRQLYRTARNYNELKRKYLNHMQFLEGGASFKNGRQMFDSGSNPLI